MMLLSAGCHGDQYDQPASRMMVFRDLPDGVEPNLPQHLVIRTAYEVLFFSVLSLSIAFHFHSMASSCRCVPKPQIYK